MSFKLNGAPYNKDNMNIGVYRRDLKDGSAGKSNHTGIIVDKDISKEMEDAVVAHETIHQHQQRNGDLDYDENNFYWKGKTYPRENLNEHNENLPWEKEAYKASNGVLNGKNKDMKERFQLKGYRGNNKPFKTLSDRGLIGPSMEGGPGDDKKLKKEAQSQAQANLQKTEFKTEKLDDGRTRHYRSAEGTADKPGSTIVKAKTTGKKTKDPEDYISKLKTRFPDATGEELVKKKYISSSYMDRFPAKKETATASEEYFTKEPSKIPPPKTPPTKTPPSETPTYTTSTKTKSKRPKVRAKKTKQKLFSCKPGTDCGVTTNKKAKKGNVVSGMFSGSRKPKRSKKGFSKRTGLVKK
jgi:hypothetical protein